MIYFFSLITIVSVIALIALFSRQVVFVSRGQIISTEQADVHKMIEPTIDYFAYHFVAICRDGAKHVAVFFLTTARELMSSTRRVAGVLEHRFANLINLVRGRGIPNNRGSVSFFLREIDEYKRVANNNQ